MSFTVHPAAPLDYAGFAAGLLAVNPALTPEQIAEFIEAHEALAATDTPTAAEAMKLGPIKLAEVSIANPRKVRVYWRRHHPSPRAPAPLLRPVARPRYRARNRHRRRHGVRCAGGRDDGDGDGGGDGSPRPLTADPEHSNAECGLSRHGEGVTGKLIRFPLRAVAAVLVCKERDGEWLTLCGSHGWIFGSLAKARTEARWLARNRGGLPIRELVGGAR